jgi:hypothetical protein
MQPMSSAGEYARFSDHSTNELATNQERLQDPHRGARGQLGQT